MNQTRREQLRFVLELQETGSNPFNFLKNDEEDIAYQYTRRLHNVPGLNDEEAVRFREAVLDHPAVELEAELSPDGLDTDKWAFTILVDDTDIEVQLDVLETVFDDVLDHDIEDISLIHGGVSGGRFEFELTGVATGEEYELQPIGVVELVAELTKPVMDTPSFIDISLDRDDEVLMVQTDFEPGQVAVGLGMDAVDFEPDRFPGVVYRTGRCPPIFTAFDGTVLYPVADEDGPDLLQTFFNGIRSPSLDVPKEFQIERRTVKAILNE